MKNNNDGTVYTTGDTTKDNWLSGITNYCPLMDEASCQNSTSLKATETAGVVEYSGLTEDKNTACYYEIGVKSPCEGKDTTLMNLKFSQKGDNAFIIVKTAKSWNSSSPKYLINQTGPVLNAKYKFNAASDDKIIVSVVPAGNTDT